jgi:ferredoxin
LKGYRYLTNVATLRLEVDRCSGCGRCAEVCPHGVFSVADGQARVDDRDACMECGACSRNCPEGAIKVDSGVGCATGLINEWLRDRVLRQPGGTCGGKER